MLSALRHELVWFNKLVIYERSLVNTACICMPSSIIIVSISSILLYAVHHLILPVQ